MYDDQERPEAFEQEPEIISTSQAVNLTTTIASLSALWALFLCFADQRSHAVRRFSVQSVGLGVAQLALAMACWILALLLGWLPVIGGVLSAVVWALFFAGAVAAFVLRVRMMLRAYRGEAYTLPVIGQSLRRFE